MMSWLDFFDTNRLLRFYFYYNICKEIFKRNNLWNFLNLVCFLFYRIRFLT